MKNLPLIFSAVIVGIILFQSVLVAPSINKLINTIDASTFLRFIWPKFFIIIAIISLASFVLMIILWVLSSLLTLQFPNGAIGLLIDLPWWLGGELN